MHVSSGAYEIFIPRVQSNVESNELNKQIVKGGTVLKGSNVEGQSKLHVQSGLTNISIDTLVPQL